MPFFSMPLCPDGSPLAVKARRVRLLWCFLAALLVSAPAVADAAKETASDSQGRDRIGLVLSGGGAKGLSHVGVLRVLEEMQIPVDFVVGTSAGAAVGALYAQGMSVREIEKRLVDMNWVSSFRDTPGRRYQPVREKSASWRVPVAPGIGVGRDGLRFGMGLVAGQNLGFILNELTRDAALVRDFDELPIPFRAVATDLATGEQVVLSRGNLADAIRASMSIPGVYAPVVVDGRTLVDGGVANNLPVSVARDLGADIIIAIDITDELAEVETLQQAFAVVAQLTTLMTRQNVDAQLDLLNEDDVLIRPDLQGLTSADFFQAPVLIELGASQARAQATELYRLAVDNDAWQDYLAGKRSRDFTPGDVQRIRIRQDSRLGDRFLRDRVRQQEGQPFDSARLEEDLNRIYGLGYYEIVSYSLAPGDDEGTELDITVREKSWGPNYLSFGLGYEENFDGDTHFNVASQLRMTELNRLGGEWQTGLQLGTEPWVRSEWFQPIEHGYRRFLAAGVEYQRERFRVFDEGRRVADVDVSTRKLDLALGTELGPDGEVRLGLERGYARVDDQVGVSAASNSRIQQGGWFLRLVHDSLNDTFMPDSGSFAGVRASLERPGLGSDSDFDRISMRLAQAGSYKRWVLFGEAFASLVTRGDAGVENAVPLGGFRRLSGYGRGEVSGQDAVVLSLMGYRRFGSEVVPLFAGVATDGGGAWDSIDNARSDNLLVSGSVFVGADTFLGPAQLAFSYNNDKHWGIYLNVGYSLGQLFD